jgi:hypothetical protein
MVKKGILAAQEELLTEMRKSDESQSMQAGVTTIIEELRSDIEKIEAQSQLKMAIYDELVLEVMVKLEQRIKEVKGGLEIQPFVDLQTADLAIDRKVKALEVANELLN